MSDEMRVKMFRTALNGYNKTDVTEYIEKMNSDFQAEKQQLQTALADAESVIEEKNTVIESQKQIIADSKDIIENYEQALDKITKLERDAEEKEQLIAAQNDALDKLCCEVEELKNKAKSEGNNELGEKARLYDTMSSQIGDILISANKNAEDIILQAKTDADKIIAAANADALSRNQKARDDARILSESLFKTISDAYGEYFTVSIGKMQSQKNAYEELIKTIENDRSELEKLSNEKREFISQIIQNKTVDPQ